MKTEKDELRKEYPEELIGSGVRGKHAERFREGAKLVAIAADGRILPDSASVQGAARHPAAPIGFLRSVTRGDDDVPRNVIMLNRFSNRMQVGSPPDALRSGL
jgi:hypothetical protein